MNPAQKHPLENPHTPVNPAERPDTVLGETNIEDLIAQANAAEHAAPDSRAFMEPKSATQGKRGRKRKNPDDPKWHKADSASQNAQTPPPGDSSGASMGGAAPNPDTDYSAAFRGLFIVGSNSLVRATKCDAVALTAGEIDSLSIVWGKVAARYLPAYLNQHAELVQAMIVTGAVGFRIKTVMDAEIARRKAEAKAKEEAIHAEAHHV